MMQIHVSDGEQTADNNALAIDTSPISSSSDNKKKVRKIKVTSHKSTFLPKNINISSASLLVSFLPLYKKLRKKIVAAPRRKVILISAIGVLAVVAISGYNSSTKDTSAPLTTQETKPPSGLTRGTPQYPTVLPAGKNIASLGGWTRVSPPGRNEVFAYVDRIGDTQVNVSQQPLPDDFKDNTTEQIDKLAIDFKASEKITVGGEEVHIGTSAKGPQSVIFRKDNLLILIKSSVKIENSQWAQYIASLQ